MNNLLSWKGLYAKVYGEECIKIMIQLKLFRYSEERKVIAKYSCCSGLVGVTISIFTFILYNLAQSAFLRKLIDTVSTVFQQYQ